MDTDSVIDYSDIGKFGKKQTKQTDHLASFKLPWKSYELKDFGDQIEMWERSHFYNMHDEDVKRINYLKPAFLERISVCV